VHLLVKKTLIFIEMHGATTTKKNRDSSYFAALVMTRFEPKYV
jgi:hypothetical protein